MTNQSLPRLRAFVDWDGDGWINKGLATDPRNLVTNPLTLVGAPYGQLPSTFGPLTPTRISHSRGMFEYQMGSSAAPTLIGYNKGTSGDFVPLFTPTATGTYTVQFNVRHNAIGSVTYAVSVQNVYPSPTNTTNITQTPLNVVTGAVMDGVVTYTFTITNITNMVIGLKFTYVTGSYSEFYVTGVSVYPGTVATQYAFNVGTELSKYDNIEADIISANWQLGHAGPFDNYPSEGTLGLQLDNSLKKFSVEYTGSPFFKYTVGSDTSFPTGRYPNTFPSPAFVEGATISVEVQNDVTLAWTEMWRGQIDSIDVGAGVSNPIALLAASQGLFKFDQSKITTAQIGGSVAKKDGGGGVFSPSRGSSIAPEAAAVSYYTVNALMGYLLSNFATLPIFPNVPAVGRLTTNDALTLFVPKPSGTMTLDTGTTDTYTSVVQAWTNDTTVAQAIKDLMQADQSSFFVLRNGSARYMFRDAPYANDPTSIAAELTWDDLMTNASDYKTANTELTSAKVEYFSSETQTGLLWNTKAQVLIPPKTQKIITAKFAYPEGSKINVTKVNGFEATVTPSTIVAKNYAGVVLAKQAFRAYISLRGSEADVVITNVSTNDIYVTVTLYGDSVITAGSTFVTVQRPSSSGNLGNKEEVVSNKLITTEAQARGIAGNILSTRARRYNSFTSMTVHARDNNWLARILSATIGTRIKYKELSYTGSIYHRVMVVGESATWTPGTLTMTYTLRPADHYPFLNLDNTYYKYGGIVY